DVRRPPLAAHEEHDVLVAPVLEEVRDLRRREGHEVAGHELVLRAVDLEDDLPLQHIDPLLGEVVRMVGEGVLAGLQPGGRDAGPAEAAQRGQRGAAEQRIGVQTLRIGLTPLADLWGAQDDGRFSLHAAILARAARSLRACRRLSWLELPLRARVARTLRLARGLARDRNLLLLHDPEDRSHFTMSLPFIMGCSVQA